jgi:hypothetical protein
MHICSYFGRCLVSCKWQMAYVLHLCCIQVNNVDDVLVCHSHFLEQCLKECMLSNPALLRTVNKLMAVCVQFCHFIQVIHLTKNIMVLYSAIFIRWYFHSQLCKAKIWKEWQYVVNRVYYDGDTHRFKVISPFSLSALQLRSTFIYIYHLHKPIASLTCFQKSTYYSGIKIFNNIPASLKSHMNENATFKIPLKWYLNTHSFYPVDEFQLPKRNWPLRGVCT